MPIYQYKCPRCGNIEEEERKVESVYDVVLCLSCGLESDGKESKIIESGTMVTFEQGSIKGRMGQ